ncbi:glycosyltransferase family 4 protein [Pseudomonas sp. SCB32]|uniref:glycosyltransferase family 4 protein n=1 Tax=Pseudomonas sp. SCB32 TaxID=2653853 RepID=UPI001263F908|nr:glycosyltransferase family 4 protein [Pseudomonas sp. SCB32]
MNVLLIHQNFPGQFRHLALDLLRQDPQSLLAIGRDTAPGLPGIRMLRYRPHRSPAQETHGYLRGFEDAVLHGQQVARLLLRLKGQGYRPDVILAHPGWGETLYAKEVFPDVPLVHFCEYYYHARGVDVGFDPEFPSSLDDQSRIRTRNALHLLNLEHCDLAITPTRWQHSLHPEAFHDKIRIAHEGVPLDNLWPDPLACLQLPDGRTLHAGQPVVTYVARDLEPYRGFHSFMRALPRVLALHPQAQVVVVGGDGVSYGRLPQNALNWRARMLEEVEIDLTRVHFLGKVPYATYLKVLQVSAAHVYLTYPFVLSWSMLEAMATGCLLIGSDTAPVREVIRHGENGYLVDFFDPSAIAEQILQALQRPVDQQPLREMARHTAQDYSVANGLKAYYRLLIEACAPQSGRRLLHADSFPVPH